MTATEHLRRDHEAIRALLGRLEGALEPLDPGKIRAACAELEALLGRHHRKEQRVLFPVLARQGISRDAPLASVLGEHAREETYAETIRTFLGVLREEGVSARPLVEACRALVAFSRAHLRREETLVLPLADAALSPEEQEETAFRMERLESLT